MFRWNGQPRPQTSSSTIAKQSRTLVFTGTGRAAFTAAGFSSTQHAGGLVSMRIRKQIEEPFGGIKTIVGGRKLRY